jgi:hypothetical protein
MKPAALLFALMVLQETRSPAQVVIGPQVGTNAGTVTSSLPSVTYLWDYGFSAGGFFEVPLSRKINFQSGLWLDVKPYEYDFSYLAEIDEKTNRVSINGHPRFGYIKIPIMLVRNFDNGFHADGGGFVSYQVLQRQNEWSEWEEIGNPIMLTAETFKDSHEITGRRWQAGIQGSFGYLYSGFDLSIHGYAHLTALFAHQPPLQAAQYLHGFSISMAYCFELAKQLR